MHSTAHRVEEHGGGTKGAGPGIPGAVFETFAGQLRGELVIRGP